MEKIFIQAPSAKLEVLDSGKERIIKIHGKIFRGGGKRALSEDLPTHLTIRTIKELVKTKGDWWLDEIDRRSKKNYVAKRLLSLLERFGGLKNAKILDMGSGCGSSAMIMIDAGAASIIGVEPVAEFVELAKHRIQDEGLEQKIKFLHFKDTTKLPFDDESFDLIVFNAVIEHIHPEARQAVLQESYRCLKPGGRVVITETPNRLFPYDGHTTHLSLLPWLPLVVSALIAKYLSRNSPRGLSKDKYLEEGLIGGSYRLIKKALPGAICLNLQPGDALWKCGLKKSSPLVCRFLKIFESIINFFNWPLTAIMPVLDLVFQKPAKK